MFRNYLGPAFARIAKAPFTSIANILTLALGLACFIAAFGIATYWQSADSYHAKSKQTYVVGQSNTFANQPAMPLNAMSTWLLAKYLRQDFPELQYAVRARGNTEMAVAAGANKLMLNQAIVDPEFLTIFDLDFVSGDPRKALSQPNSVVLTEETAARLFGNMPALGRPLIVDGKDQVSVTGVIRSVRQPSFMGSDADAVLRFDYLRDWASSPQGAAVDKLDSSASMLSLLPFTFVVLPENMSADALNAKLPSFIERRISAADRSRAKTIMQAFPLAELKTFNLDRTLFASSGVSTSAVGALLALAALTLAIACVNYANLATAQATGRAKEVGMRRVLGAGTLRVMGQAWLEAIVLTTLAAGVALAVLVLAAPVIKASMGIDLLYFLSGGIAGLGVIAALVVFVAFVAGAYPALALSHVRPAAALQSGKSRSGSKVMTRILVAIQFASAGFLLILVTVTQLQRKHLEETVLAPRGSPVIVLNDLMRAGIDYATLEQRLSSQPGIEVVSVADIPPWSTLYNGTGFSRSPDASAAPMGAMVKSIGHDYHKAFNLPLLAGRTFERDRDTRPVSLFARNGPPIFDVIIDRQMSGSLGFDTPEAAVGETVYMPTSITGGAARPIRVIGVTETETTMIETQGGRGIVYTYGPRALWGEQRPIIRVAPGKTAAALDSINRVFGELAPNIPPQIRFYDEQFEQGYRQYGRVSELFILLASTAFIIASIGLLGIAVHVASKRRHEIALRKTLGSSAARVVRLLLTDFSQPVLIGNLIAWPLAWIAAETYLKAFSNRIELSPVPFIISLAITLAIAWGATIGVVLRAATQRPADVLRRA
jgi:putative ABC transport system permease protein